MERTATEKIRLGIFVLIGTILLVLGAYLIGNQQNLFGERFSVNAVFKNVNGLQKGNNVRYSGINIGTVNGIEMINDTTIKVTMIIEEKMRKHIRKNAIATIGSDGLVGSMIINIVPGDGQAQLINSGDKIGSYSRIATADMLNTLNVTNENAALLTQDLLMVTESLKNGKGVLGRLLNDTTMANDLKKSLTNLKDASSQANTTIKNLNEMVKKMDFENSVVNVLLGDSISAQKLTSIIDNIEVSSNEIKSMTQNLDSLSISMAKGDGALNYITTDTLLVNQLQSTIKNMEQGVERFNENMEALKHNFLTRRYFRKLEKQQKKMDKNGEKKE